MKFYSMSSRIAAVALLVVLSFGFFRAAPHFMKNKESIKPRIETAEISETQLDTSISIARLPTGFYKVKKILASSLDEKGQKKVFVSIQSINGLSKEQLLDSTGTILEIYWYQPVADIKLDYNPGDVIERPINRPLSAICHKGIVKS